MPTITYYATTIDCSDHTRLAEFYAELLGWVVQYSDETVAYIAGEDGKLGFQKVAGHPALQNEIGKQFQLDFAVTDINAAAQLAIKLGAHKLPASEGSQAYRAYRDPEGYTFCLAAGVE